MRFGIILFSSIMLITSCTKKECRFPGAYKFTIPVELSPIKEVYNIGDTISITSMFSDRLYEEKTDREYDLVNFKFYPAMRLREISDSIADEAGALYFDIAINDEFNFNQFNYSDGAIGYIGDYNYENNSYKLNYKIIPQSSGLFHFSHLTALTTLGHDQEFEGKCRNVDVGDSVVELNNGASNNFHLVNESPDPHYNEWMLGNPEARFHKHGGYCFRVVE